MPVALDESEDHEKNVDGIPDYEIPKSFADESFRLIDNGKMTTKVTADKIVLNEMTTILPLFITKK